MILIGIMMISMLGSDSFIKGLISGGLGILFSFIGFDPITGAFRYTFGFDYLYGGLDIVVVIIGLFAFAQMISLLEKGEPISNVTKDLEGFRGVYKGIAATVKNYKVCLKGSLLGALVGIVPGVGGTVANILAYGSQVASSKDRDSYGTGNIKGVIAPESSNNAKEGGALLTTLAFGIPGSAGMAILMSVLMLKGITPGPNMITEYLPLTVSFVLIIIGANILAAILSLSITPIAEKITTISINSLAPIIIFACTLGTYSINGRLSDIITAYLFGVFGYFMHKYNYSPAAFIIGFLLGSKMERMLHISIRAWGPLFFLQRPISLFLLVLIIFLIVWPFINGYFIKGLEIMRLLFKKEKKLED